MSKKNSPVLIPLRRESSDDLSALAARVEKEIDTRLGEVFGAHQLMLNDSSLRDELRNREQPGQRQQCREDGISALGKPLLLEYGSAGSHAALFAREMGLPCISGFPDLLATVPDVPLYLCGELAGRPEHIPRLLQCGIRTFSKLRH